MAAIIEALGRVESASGQVPVVVGGLAVMSRLSSPYRATVDLDVVDRGHTQSSILEVLRQETDAEPVDPSAVNLSTSFGLVRVDVLQVRQIEIDEPSDDPGDRLHATSHAWAFESATAVHVSAVARDGTSRAALARIAEPGPLIAMKLQALMDRTQQKQGTDLQDIVRLILDGETRGAAISQLSTVEQSMANDISQHVDLWLVQRRIASLESIRGSGGTDLSLDDIDLVAELLGTRPS